MAEQMTPLGRALDDLAEEFEDTAGLGEHFTCSEADAVARVLALTGHPNTAASFLLGHSSEDDDESYAHYGWERSDELATEYVAAMLEDPAAPPPIVVGLSPDAVAVVAGLVAPTDDVNQSGIYAADQVRAEIHSAFPLATFQEWAGRHELERDGVGYAPEAGE